MKENAEVALLVEFFPRVGKAWTNEGGDLLLLFCLQSVSLKRQDEHI